MRIHRLWVRNLRNFADISIEPAGCLNLFLGPNAAGKTALLEAIYLLARGRSFRSPRVEEVIQYHSPSFQVSAEIFHGVDGSLVTGVERGAGRLLLRYAGQTVKTISAHARKFPMVLITPDSQQLVLGGPKVRRNWMDWAMFHVEPAYLATWRDYHRSLRQRNRLLKRTQSGKELHGWEELMSQNGVVLDQARRQFLRGVNSTFTHLFELAGWGEPPEITLQSGWAVEEPLLESLMGRRREDASTGHTGCGPHRADLAFHVNGNELGARYSRGQSKLFVTLLMLAEAQVVFSRTGEEPLLLVDDFAAELDRQAQGRLLSLLSARPGQAFLTSVNFERHWALPNASARFHVEHGAIAKMVE